MWLILLEALGALVVLLLIVWWTMFAGRPHGERRGQHAADGERRHRHDAVGERRSDDDAG